LEKFWPVSRDVNLDVEFPDLDSYRLHMRREALKERVAIDSLKLESKITEDDIKKGGFEQLGVSPSFVEVLDKEFGISEPTNVQSMAIPAIHNGLDVVCASQTGFLKYFSLYNEIIDIFFRNGKNPCVFVTSF